MSAFRDLLAKCKKLIPPTITDENEEYREILEAAGREAADALDNAGVVRQIGWTETYWATKKSILLRKYGLKWKPPKY